MWFVMDVWMIDGDVYTAAFRIEISVALSNRTPMIDWGPIRQD